MESEVSWTHIHSHELHPINELADVTAKQVSKRGAVGSVQPLPPVWKRSLHIYDWAWIVALGPERRARAGYPLANMLSSGVALNLPCGEVVATPSNEKALDNLPEIPI